MTNFILNELELQLVTYLRLEAEQVVSLILKGHSFSKIAEDFDCTSQTVRNRWKVFENRAEEYQKNLMLLMK